VPVTLVPCRWVHRVSLFFHYPFSAPTGLIGQLCSGPLVSNYFVLGLAEQAPLVIHSTSVIWRLVTCWLEAWPCAPSSSTRPRASAPRLCFLWARSLTPRFVLASRRMDPQQPSPITTRRTARPCLQAHKIHVPASSHPPGGLRILYDFYSTLFSAVKQSGKSSATVTTDAAQVANSTLSYGELHFLLKDFGVMPQLISKTELTHVLGTRIVGQALRARRKRLDVLHAALKTEEDALAADILASRTIPSGSGGAAAARQRGAGDKGGRGTSTLESSIGGRLSGATPGGEARVPLLVSTGGGTAAAAGGRNGGGDASIVSASVALAAARVPQRRARLAQLHAAIASHGPGSELGVSTASLRQTTNEDRMAHGPYELSYLEFLEVCGGRIEASWAE
jgi:hypothetical protein